MITIIQPTYYLPETTVQMFPFLMEHVERCGRICYKSEDRITEDSAERFVNGIRKSGHESVLEHALITAIVICSRACSHQLVRHRIAAYSQESQRYCDYGKKDSLQVVCPPSIGLLPGDYQGDYDRDRYEWILWRDDSEHHPVEITCANEQQVRWVMHIDSVYDEYMRELKEGIKPEDARYLLPNATKTELAVTFNLRQWRHVFRERALNRHAQWEIRGIFSAILVDLKKRFPAIFCDLE